MARMMLYKSRIIKIIYVEEDIVSAMIKKKI